MPRHSFHLSRRHQRGAVLAVGLVVLVMLTVLGVAAYRGATENTRIAGNSREVTTSFESAEAALRACEADIARGVSGFPDARPNTSSTQLWEMSRADWQDPTKVHLQVNQFNGVVAVAPACFIERLSEIKVRVNDGSLKSGAPLEPQTVYRITATGFGSNDRAVTQLQSTFRQR